MIAKAKTAMRHARVYLIVVPSPTHTPDSRDWWLVAQP